MDTKLQKKQAGGVVHETGSVNLEESNSLLVTAYPDVAARIENALAEREHVLITTSENFGSRTGLFHIEPVSNVSDVAVTIRKVFDKWQLVGKVEWKPETPGQGSEVLSREKILRPVSPFTHNAQRGKYDCEPSYGPVKKAAFVSAGAIVQIGSVSIRLPDTGFENPFQKDMPLYKERVSGSLFKSLIRGIVNVRHPEILSGERAANTPEDSRNQFDSMYRGSANKYVCVFDRINEMHQEVYGTPIPVFDLEQLRERWGFSDLHVPNMSSITGSKLDNHRISAAGEIGIPIKVNWIAVDSLT